MKLCVPSPEYGHNRKYVIIVNAGGSDIVVFDDEGIIVIAVVGCGGGDSGDAGPRVGICVFCFCLLRQRFEPPSAMRQRRICRK